MRRAVRRRRADELLEQFGLAERARERVDSYSGGMAQRLMIARALMHDPAVLFLDEPTTGLDPQSRLFLWGRVEELRAAGTTILLTTHDMIEADRLCDRIAIIDHGERIARDTPDGLRALLPGGHGVDWSFGPTRTRPRGSRRSARPSRCSWRRGAGGCAASAVWPWAR